MNKIYTLLIFGFIIQFNVFSQDQAEIIKAINENNCEVLFNFIREPKDKEEHLITSAKYIINKYTTPDAYVRNFRTSSMNARVRSPEGFLLNNLFIDPQKYLPMVVEKLTADTRSNFVKVKIIHDWICHNIAYDVDTFFGKSNGSQDYISVIKNRKGVCSGYVTLFNQMCMLASIESIGISGYSKGYGYDERRGASLDHEWNAVKINNRWYLVDVTWDAGCVDGSAFLRNYSTHYLFLDSEQFRYDHLPAENKYQFYAPVMTKQEFEKDDNYKKINNNRSYIEKISIERYERQIIPSLDDLLKKKKISDMEKRFYIAAYCKTPENGYYYFIEDQFAVARNRAVEKISPLLNLNY
jgi:transglutaminase/protease-like cytokinesis protein 3